MLLTFEENLLHRNLSKAEQSIMASWYLDAIHETRAFLKEAFFDIPTSPQIRGDLENLAIDRAFKTMIEREAIKGSFQFHPYKRPTGKFLLMTVKELNLIPCRLISHDDFPKYKRAAYRDLYRANNEEPQLGIPFEEHAAAEPVTLPAASPHLFMITHGHIKGSGPFLNLSYPDAQRETFKFQSQNLLLLPRAIRDDLPEAALPDSDVGATLRTLLEENLDAHLILNQEQEENE